jgi:hypothetical protein
MAKAFYRLIAVKYRPLDSFYIAFCSQGK